MAGRVANAINGSMHQSGVTYVLMPERSKVATSSSQESKTRCRRQRVAVLAVSSLFFVQSIGTSAAQETNEGNDVDWPFELGGFIRGEVIDFEQQRPGLGVGVAYDSHAVHANVYVYSGGVVDLPEGIGSPLVRGHMQQVESEVLEYNEGTEILSPSAPGRGRCDAFLRTKFSMTHPQDPGGDGLRSYLYLGSFGGSFVKARVTFAENDDAAANDAAHERFAQALCELIRS